MSDSRLYDRLPREGPPAHEPMRDRPPPRRRRLLTVLGVLFLLVALGVVGVVTWVQRQVDPSGQPGERVTVDIPAGSSTQRIAAILDDEGVIDSARTFLLYLRTKNVGQFQAGSYNLRQNMAFSDVVGVLEKGPVVTFDRLTIPEGLTLEQIADRVGRLPGRSKDRFLEVAASGVVRSRYQPPDSTNLEGLLFPDTYKIDAKEDEQAILQRMVTSFDAVAAQSGLDQVTEGGLVTPYQAVIVASLVEREANRDEDRGAVARVIYNRLKRNMLLQIDATLLYARGEHKNRVLDSDKAIESPYNTYKKPGLPPTPISAVGKAALVAAIDPPPGDALFYVTINDCTGETVFATTNAEHERNVARRRSENPGQDRC
ncbi:MAG TPA: endolytic transglycosylase MltG [Acidimicrobiales bacterium]|nr:endolytic transglycosylase MltG [Acidimicrobiales bacterium]